MPVYIYMYVTISKYIYIYIGIHIYIVNIYTYGEYIYIYIFAILLWLLCAAYARYCVLSTYGTAYCNCDAVSACDSNGIGHHDQAIGNRQ